MTLEYQRIEEGVYGRNAVVVLGGLGIAAGLGLAILSGLSGFTRLRGVLSTGSPTLLVRLLPLLAVFLLGLGIAYVGYGLVRRQRWAGRWGSGLCNFLAIVGGSALLGMVAGSLEAITSGLAADQPMVLLGGLFVCGVLGAVMAIGFFVGRFLRSPSLEPLWRQYQTGVAPVRSVTRITVGLIVLTTFPSASGLTEMGWPPKSTVAAFLVPLSIVVDLLLLAACIFRTGSLLPGTLAALLLWHGVQWQLGTGDENVDLLWLLSSGVYWSVIVVWFHRELSDPDRQFPTGHLIG